MYPRNAASPEPIGIGPVIQISDGAVQSAGVTVRIKPIGVAEADGAGTTAYSTDGIVLYTPTQAETNYTSFVLIAKKTGCIPATITVVTSASATAGHAGTDQSKIANPTSTVNLSGTTIKNAADNASQTSLDTLDDYVDTEVAAIKAKTDNLPASPAAVSDIPTANQNRDAIWNALLADYTTANTFGHHVIRSVNNNNTVQISGGGSNHIFAVLHDAEPDSIPEDAFVTGAVSARVIADNALTAAKIATDAITSTQLAASAVTAIKDAIATITTIADLATMIMNDGTANARYTVSALQNGPSGEGGQTINVYPVSASTPERVAGTTITFYRDEARAVSVVTDFTLTSLTLRFVIEDSEGTDVLVIEDGSISRSSQTFTVSIPDSVTAKPTSYKWALRDVTGATNSVLARGVFSVQEAASDA
jgi:hypothetical protein